MEQLLEYTNTRGDVVLLKEQGGFSVLCSIIKMPGIYRCRVKNAPDYNQALRHFNQYRGVLKRIENTKFRNK